MTNYVTDIYKNMATGGDISLSADTFYCALLADTISDLEPVAIQSITDYSDIASHEITGTGYTTSGSQLLNLSLSADALSHKSIWNADDLSWTNATFTTKGAVIYKDGGYPVIGVIFFTDDEVDPLEVQNSSFNLKFTNGIMNII